MMQHANAVPRDGHQWGLWCYDAKRLALEYDDPANKDWYEVDLEACRTAAEVLDWILQVSKKRWISREGVGWLVQALDELLDPQANLCRDGRSGRLDVKQLLKGKRLAGRS